MNGDISFNGNDLQTFEEFDDSGNPYFVGIITNLIDHTNQPDEVAQLFALADADGSSIPSTSYPSKRIVIGGTIHGSTQDDLDARIDTFKSYFNGKNKNLDIDYRGGTRRYVATKNALSIEREQTSLYATFRVEFICTVPFGIDTSATDLWATKNNFTNASFTETPTVEGSAPYQYPVITITIDAVTGAGDYVMISNDNNNQELMIYGQGLVATDVIVIDCVQRIVTLNGDEIDYDGTFLELEPGANSITYTDGFTTRTVDVSAVYTKRWL